MNTSKRLTLHSHDSPKAHSHRRSFPLSLGPTRSHWQNSDEPSTPIPRQNGAIISYSKRHKPIVDCDDAARSPESSKANKKHWPEKNKQKSRPREAISLQKQVSASSSKSGDSQVDELAEAINQFPKRNKAAFKRAAARLDLRDTPPRLDTPAKNKPDFVGIGDNDFESRRNSVIRSPTTPSTSAYQPVVFRAPSPLQATFQDVKDMTCDIANDQSLQVGSDDETSPRKRNTSRIVLRVEIQYVLLTLIPFNRTQKNMSSLLCTTAGLAPPRLEEALRGLMDAEKRAAGSPTKSVLETRQTSQFLSVARQRN